MKYAALVFFVLFLIIPNSAYAACSANGYTVVFVNGILTSEDQAKKQNADLRDTFITLTGRSDVVFINGYNPTHLAGLGDLAQTVAQAFGTSISDYDLNTILLQIYPEVQTRRLLLVGHSQGAFYADGIYNYLVAHGEPKEALGVYDIGTPASSVAGGGKYLNSKEDILLGWLRSTLHFNPLPPNVDIPITGQDATNNPFAGHSLEDAYLAGAPGRIVSDISGELAALQPTYASPTGACFDPPVQGLVYNTERVTFAIADPAAKGLEVGSVAAYNGTVAVASAAAALARAAGGTVATIWGRITGVSQSINNAVANNPNNPAAPQNIPANFTVVKALYGSSLNPSDVRELLNTPGASQGGAVALALPPGAGEFASTIATTTVPTTSTTTPSATSTAPKIFPAAASGGGATTFTGDEDLATTTEESATSTPLLFTASTTPPALAIAECAYSLARDRCLVATTSVRLSWSLPPGTASYSIILNRKKGMPLATSSITLALSDNMSSTIQVVAYDASSTPLFSEGKSIYTASQPMLINEIAWGGTSASPDDQWIELKNTTPYWLDTTHLALVAREGGSQYIPLQGISDYYLAKYYYASSTPSQGIDYYAFERLDDAIHIQLDPNIPLTTLSTVPFDLLNTAGEQLALVWETDVGATTLDETPPVAACGGWCAGTSGGDIADHDVFSMERSHALGAGDDPRSWVTNDGYYQPRNIIADRNYSQVFGTPQMENSLQYPPFGVSCGALIAEGSVFSARFENCLFFSAFIRNSHFRVAALFDGVVGSSTAIQSFYRIGEGPAGAEYTMSVIVDNVLAPIPPGEPMFFAVWTADPPYGEDIDDYLKNGTALGLPTPSPDLLRTVSFTYEPRP